MLRVSLCCMSLWSYKRVIFSRSSDFSASISGVYAGVCYLCVILHLSTNSCYVCSQKLLRSPRKPTRKISKIPFKVLDAPELQDDFYLNLVDWSSLNVLSVGLGTCVYLWSACTSQVATISHTSNDCFVLKVNKVNNLFSVSVIMWNMSGGKGLWLVSLLSIRLSSMTDLFATGDASVWPVSRGRLCHVSGMVGTSE